jgi:anthranilate phosphoribosyltransferase
VLAHLIKALDGTPSLSNEQIKGAVDALIGEQEPTTVKADFLIALAKKGETVQEIAGFARELQAKALRPPIDPRTRQLEIIDVCGMGGDRMGTFNISTTVALVVASAGVPVAKHGNRAITSQAGSADVLEELGIPINLAPDQAAQALRDQQFAFFFAPLYHPAFRQIGPARKLCAERGQRTIFNILGPLLNPAQPSAQLVGVPAASLCEPIARVLQALGLRRAMVVCGQVEQGWLDELSILGENMIAEFYQDRAFHAGASRMDGLEFQPCTLKDLLGGDRSANANIVRRLVSGLERGPKRDVVLLNAAAALLVSGKARSLTEGWAHAEELIDTGRVAAKLKELSVHTIQ